jgi:hypothetical protein
MFKADAGTEGPAAAERLPNPPTEGSLAGARGWYQPESAD